MKLLYKSLKVAELHIIKGLLESYGIECEVKREEITGFAGQIPWSECLAELWVLNDQDFEKAEKILKEQL
ncbi:MAG: DUF2007 domain-containing protein [Candidatus Omnitrophica bacterium]|nr:DUF2007 domain-containing protein [Candidatus Omnitrophota bacterium]